MKNNQLAAALSGIFLICALSTFWFTWQYRSSTKTFLEAQNKAAYVEAVRPLLESLLHDTVEYSKKNPAVNPILQSVTNPAPAVAKPAPATKPAAK